MNPLAHLGRGLLLAATLIACADTTTPPANRGPWEGQFIKGETNQADHAITLYKGVSVTFEIEVTVNVEEAPDRTGYIHVAVMDGATQVAASAQCGPPAGTTTLSCTWTFDKATREDGVYTLRVVDDTGYANPDRWIGWNVAIKN